MNQQRGRLQYGQLQYGYWAEKKLATFLYGRTAVRPSKRLNVRAYLIRVPEHPTSTHPASEQVPNFWLDCENYFKPNQGFRFDQQFLFKIFT